MENENNIINIEKRDRAFIKAVMSLSPEKKATINGIMIGMVLQDVQNAKEETGTPV